MTTVCPSTRHSPLAVPFVSRWFLFTQKTAASSRRPEPHFPSTSANRGARTVSARFVGSVRRVLSRMGRKGFAKNRELAHKIEKYLKTIFLIHIRRTPAPRLLYPSISEQQWC